MLRRRGLLQILAVEQRHVHRLPDQIQQIFPRKFHEQRAQEDVIMDVVDAQRKAAQANIGGVRLKLHPGRMDGGWHNSGVGHPLSATRVASLGQAENAHAKATERKR